MARIALVTQVVTDAGITPVYTAATDAGATYSIDANAEIEVINGGGGTVVATIETAGTLAGLAVADRTVSIPAGQRRRIGHFDQRAYPRASGVSDAGKIYVNLDVITSVTAGAFA